jgi:protein subunit release factor B
MPEGTHHLLVFVYPLVDDSINIEVKDSDVKMETAEAVVPADRM